MNRKRHRPRRLLIQRGMRYRPLPDKKRKKVDKRTRRSGQKGRKR